MIIYIKYENLRCENNFGEQMFGGFFIESPKILVNIFGENGFLKLSFST